MKVMKKPLFILLPLMALQVSASIPLIQETFEVSNGMSAGSIDGQNGWEGSAVVQTGTTYAGTQALEIQNGEASHDLSSSNSAVWARFQARVTAAPESNPEIPADNTSVAFFINTNLTLTVYSNATPIEVSTVTVALDTWVQFDVYCDYAALTWTLSMDGANVLSGLPLYSTNQQPAKILISNNSPAVAYVDDLTISDEELATGAPDSDSDGIPDWWEQKHYGGATASIATDPSSNGTLTQGEAYVAGVDPLTNDPFLISEIPGEAGLRWTAHPGRLYDVQWTEDLSVGFTTVATLSLPETEYIDSAHPDQTTGFYQLKARME